MDAIGTYHVVRLLGRGGMGIVYEVEDPSGRHFALKRFSKARKNGEFLKGGRKVGPRGNLRDSEKGVYNWCLMFDYFV